jgi:hypothetical protein
VPFCRQTPLTLKALRAKDYSENPGTLGEHLKKRRRELGLLQREAANRIGVSAETVSNWESGKTEPVPGHFSAGGGLPRLRPYSCTQYPHWAIGSQTAATWGYGRTGSKTPRMGPRIFATLPGWNLAPIVRTSGSPRSVSGRQSRNAALDASPEMLPAIYKLRRRRR